MVPDGHATESAHRPADGPSRWDRLLGTEPGDDRASNGTWSGVGHAYWAESFPTRVRGTAVGWLGAMFTAGQILGSGVWTGLIAAHGAIALLIVGCGFAVLQGLSTLLLPNIRPGKELEEVAT